jgi:plastocyanin
MTMKSQFKSIRKRVAHFAVAALMAGLTTSAVSATQWEAWVGAQSPDLGSQVQSFLPNEMWIHAGDSIRWSLTSSQIHTVSFLTPGQVRPPTFGMVFGVGVGCPGTPSGNTPDGASFDGQPATATVGVGEVVTTTGAGSQSVALVRFLQDVVVVRVGGTVEWTNHDPVEPHTVTQSLVEFCTRTGLGRR